MSLKWAHYQCSVDLLATEVATGSKLIFLSTVIKIAYPLIQIFAKSEQNLMYFLKSSN